MLTVEKFRKVVPAELRNLPEVEYPAEVTAGWDDEMAEIKTLIAQGELISMTADEFAADHRRRR